MRRHGPRGDHRSASATAFRPRARHDGLVVREVADEVLVYDLERHRAHALNRPALLVWRQCDGQTTVRQLAVRLGQELPGPVDEEVVWLALAELERARLLQERLPQREAISRRLVLARLAGTVILPAVASVVAPHPAAAQSGVTSTCNTPGTCGTFVFGCSGNSACVCFTNAEGGLSCTLDFSCGVSPCTSSAECGAGSACLVDTCCGSQGFCSTICTPGTSAPARALVSGPTGAHR